MTPPICPLHRRAMAAQQGEVPTFEMGIHDGLGRRVQRVIWKCPIALCRYVENGPMRVPHNSREFKMKSRTMWE
jgi:hypothetical protein